jgi:hypothetical protein
LLGLETQALRLTPAARGGIPVESSIPASERSRVGADPAELGQLAVEMYERELPAPADLELDVTGRA